MIGDPSYFTDRVQKVGDIVRCIAILDHPVEYTDKSESLQIIIPQNQVKVISPYHAIVMVGRSLVKPTHALIMVAQERYLRLGRLFRPPRCSQGQVSCYCLDDR